MKAILLLDSRREAARQQIIAHHYTHSVSSGKSYYLECGEAFVVWSIPANKNLGQFFLAGQAQASPVIVWELSRLWAPDGHAPNLLTQAISAAVKWIATAETPDFLVSYADPNAGHTGGVYRAASWLLHGQSEEVRAYRRLTDGQIVARRAFHSGKKCLRKSEIEALGYSQLKLPGKFRFVKPISRRAKRLLNLD